jgi:hypothetical protein
MPGSMSDKHTENKKYKYANLLFEEFKRSPNAACYEKVHMLVFEEFTHVNLNEIKKHDNGQKKCIFLCISEPHWYEPGALLSRQFITIIDLLREQQIFNVDFYIPCFGDRFTNDFEILNKNNFGWSFLKYITDMPYMQDILKRSLIEPSADLEIEKIQNNFLHMNYTHREHRQLFSKFLIKENLLEKNCVAINTYTYGAEEHSRDKNWFVPLHSDACIPVGQKDEWFYSQNLLDLWRDTDLQDNRHPSIDKKTKQPQYDFINCGAIYIVSETVFNHPYPVFSEKTISALLGKRPFIIIGPAHSMKTLKQKGYKTFDNFMDESYDNVSDPNERLEKIFKLVKTINNKSLDELKVNVLQSKDRIMHNQNIIIKGIRKYTKDITQ